MIQLPALSGTERELWCADRWCSCAPSSRAASRRASPATSMCSRTYERAQPLFLGSSPRSPISLVADPFRLRDELGPRNARRIAAVEALDNDEHEAWLLLPQPQRLEGITARTLIVATT